MSNTIPGTSRFPCGVLLAQHRIEDVMLGSLKRSPCIEIMRQSVPVSMEIDSTQMAKLNSHPVTIKLRRATEKNSARVLNGTTNHDANGYQKENINNFDDPAHEETIRAKYVLGCDGAHSWTREQLGFHMEGEQWDFIWGVLGE